MAQKTNYLFLILLLFFISSSIVAKDANYKVTPENKSTVVDNATLVDANNILMFVTNHGNFGRDLSGMFGYDYGTWYPYTGDLNDYANHTIVANYSPLYAAGLWIGGKVDNQVRVSVSEYTSEFVPGPMLNNTFMADVPEFRVYKLYGDSLLSNPNQDFLDWPISQGAPLDESNNPKMRGDQMLWSVFNDADPAKHTNMASTLLGVEVQMTTIVDNTYNSSLFIEYKIYNKGTNIIDSCYIGHWSDPDLGSAGDDFTGCDTLNNIWYCYNSSDSDASYNSLGVAPPALGFKLLYGPMVPSNGDSAYFDGNYIADYKNLPMTAFNHYLGATDPDDPQSVFNYMKGLTKFGTPYMYNGNPVKYTLSGYPLTGQGDLDAFASDRRMMASTGPFTLAPGDSQFVMIRMSVAISTSNIGSVVTLKSRLNEPFNTPTDIDDDTPNELPSAFSLSQNYPNPFNPSTQIQFSIPSRSDVIVEVFNTLGQKVATLIDDNLSAGTHIVEWDASEVSTGVYFYKLTAGDFVQSKKMILLK